MRRRRGVERDDDICEGFDSYPELVRNVGWIKVLTRIRRNIVNSG